MSGGVKLSARSEFASHSDGRRNLLGSASQASGAVTSMRETSIKSPVDQRRRRFIRNKMPGELTRDMLGRCRTSCQREQHRAALFEAAVTVIMAHYALGSRFVQPLVEREHAAAVLPQRHDAPAGNDLGKIGDVGLTVTGAHADGVQFHDLAREILVQPAVAVLAGAA